MCAKNHLLIFSSFLDIWENVEWPRFFGPPCIVASRNGFAWKLWTLLLAEFQPPKLSLQSDLRRRVASPWALPQISSFFLLFLFVICYIAALVPFFLLEFGLKQFFLLLLVHVLDEAVSLLLDSPSSVQSLISCNERYIRAKRTVCSGQLSLLPSAGREMSSCLRAAG